MSHTFSRWTDFEDLRDAARKVEDATPTNRVALNASRLAECLSLK